MLTNPSEVWYKRREPGPSTLRGATMNFLTPQMAEHSLSATRNYLARVESLGTGPIPTPAPCEPPEVTIEPEPQEPESILIVEAKPNIGRSGPALPQYLKETIATLAQHEIKQSDIAEAFGVSDSTVSNFANGLNNSRKPDESLQKAVQTTRDEIEQEALAKTMMTLGLIEQTDIMMMGAKDKSIVASNLSKVAANLRGKDTLVDNRVQMIIHAPQVRTEHHYQEIDV